MRQRNKKVSLLIILFFFTNLGHSLLAQNLFQIVSVDIKGQRLEDALASISKQGGFYFSYSSNIIPNDSVVSVSARNNTVKEVLDVLLEEKYEYKEALNYIILRPAPYRLKLTPDEVTDNENWYTVAGYVTDERTGAKVNQASVYEKRLLSSTLTDRQGYFKLKIKKRESEIALTVSKELYRDVTLVILPSTLVQPGGNDDSGYNPDTDPDRVERTAFARLLLSSKQKMQSINLGGFFTNKPFQASLTPGLSTHGIFNSQVVNKFSLNLVGGYTTGVKGLEMAGVFNINKNDVKYVQAAGVFNTVGGSVLGVQLAGVTNTVLDSVTGFEAAGVYNQVNSSVSGAQLAGALNIVKGEVEYFQASGALNIVGGGLKGVQLSGFGNIVMKDIEGVQVTGAYNLANGSLSGAQVSGAINFIKGNADYFQTSGAINIVGGNFEGVQISGANNTVLKDVDGVQITGLYNYAHGDLSGFQLAGGFNIAGKKVDGTQLSGAINIANKGLDGVQLSVFGNFSRGEVDGLQFSSVFNYAKKLNGFQVGLINIADSSSGISIGLVNLSRNGYHKIALSNNDVLNVNIAFQSGNAKLYTILLAGTNVSDRAKAHGLGVGIGHDFILNKRMLLATQLTSQVIYLGDWENVNVLDRVKATLNFSLFKGLSVFAGPVYNVYFKEKVVPKEGYKTDISPIKSHKLSNDVSGWIGWEAGITIF